MYFERQKKRKKKKESVNIFDTSYGENEIIKTYKKKGGQTTTMTGTECKCKCKKKRVKQTAVQFATHRPSSVSFH